MSCRAIDLMPLVSASYREGGMCFSDEDEQQVSQLIFTFNQAIPLLMKRLDSKGTLSRWTVPVMGGVFGLPLDCLEVRQVFLNSQNLTLRDQWYEGKLGYKVNTCGLFCGHADLIDLGDGYATPEPWPAHLQDARYGVMAESDGDAGKAVQIQGRDRYGNIVEEEITLLPYQQVASSESALTDLNFQHKGVTNGAVVGFVTTPHSPNQRILRIPSKVPVPSFHRKKVPTPWGGCSGTLHVIGKLRYFPITDKTDVIPICDPAALSFAFQAIAALERKDLAAYNASLTFAVSELEKEMMDSSPAGVVTQMSVKSGLNFGRKLFT